MTIFWIILGLLFFTAWLIHLLYCLGDERRRFRIVETRNGIFRIEKRGLFIPVWWRAAKNRYEDYIATWGIDCFSLSDYKTIQCNNLEEAQEVVDAHFKLIEHNRKDKEIVNVWTLNKKP